MLYPTEIIQNGLLKSTAHSVDTEPYFCMLTLDEAISYLKEKTDRSVSTERLCFCLSISSPVVLSLFTKL
jgi:hypothetical protein